MRCPRAPLAVTACLAVSILSTACPHGRHDATVHHRFDDPEAWSKVFDDPARDAWQKPVELVDWLALEPGQTVADLGTGTGYLVPYLARAVGAGGKVLAVDIEPSLVEHVAARARSASLPQVEAVLGLPDDPKLPAARVDLVVVVDTWHHIDARLDYLARLRDAVAPGGRVAIVDFKSGEIPVGPPPAHRLAASAVEAEFAKGGWALAESNDELLPYQYVRVFTPPAKP